jgi:hypothetical protein
VRKLNNRLVLAAAGGVALAGAISLPAGAAPSAHIVARAASGSQAFAPAIPTSKIKGQGSTAVFKPSTLTVTEDTSGGACSETNPPTSFMVKNTGTATAFVTFGGAPAFALPKATTEIICLSGGAAGSKAQLGLANKKDTKTYAGKLKITTSD